MESYYSFIKKIENEEDKSTTSYYQCNKASQGAWNPHEQHMAAATGIICAELEQFSPATENMRFGRIGLDIWGLIHFGEFSITTKVIRAGKTIQLIEAVMESKGQTCIVARAWKMLTQDTQQIEGLSDQKIINPTDLPIYPEIKNWPGGFIESVDVRFAKKPEAGEGVVWVTNDLEMIEGKKTSDFVHLIGMIDIANGIAPRQDPALGWMFPNLDLQIYMYRMPQGKWLGLKVCQQYGADGIGLTSSILHDEIGPFGRSEQVLTLRPIPKK